MQEISVDFIVLGPVWYVAFLLSITCHEGAHSLAALWGGDKTALEAGQVTLNPLPHIQREPVGTVVVPLISYFMAGWMMGWASAPYDPYWAQRYPRRAAWMAAAGPAANLLLVFVAAFFIRLGVALEVFRPPQTATFEHITEAYDEGTMAAVATLLSIVFVLNLALFLFNLIPVPPLDGSSVITLFMDENTAEQFRTLSADYGMIGLLLAWYLFQYIFDPVYTLALNVLYPGAGYG